MSRRLKAVPRRSNRLTALGGLDVLVDSASTVRVGRREKPNEAEVQAMIDVTVPILLAPAAPPVLRNSGDL
jgi:hypothetical protein